MTIQIARFLLVLIACFIFLVEVGSAAALQAAAAGERSGPKASATVDKMLQDAQRLADAKQPLESLKTAKKALEAARQTDDTTGAALAQEGRARALQDLRRADEAIAAWQEAARLWAEDGYAPGRIIALVQAGLLSLPEKRSEAEKFFVQGLSIGKLETERPAALAHALYDSGVGIAEKGEEPTAMDYLNSALLIEEKQASESLKLVETLSTYAKVALDRGDKNNDAHYWSVAIDTATRAATLGQHVAPDSAVVVRSLHTLAYAEDRLYSGTQGNAVEHYLAAIEIQRKLQPQGSIEEAEILRDLGNFEENQGKFTASQGHLEEAVAIGERMAPESAEFEHSLEDLAIVESDQGKLSVAREHLQRALAIKEKLHGNLAPTFINLGAVAADESDYAAARDYIEQALALFMKAPHKTAGVSFALADLSEIFARQGDLASALKYLRRAIASEDSPESNLAANNLSGMGDLLRQQGNFTDAAKYYQRALNLRQKLAPDSFYVSDTLQGLAKLARAQHNISLAMEYDRHALELAQKSCPDGGCTPRFLNELGELAYEHGDFASSENYLRRAVEIREKNLGSQHPDLARSLNDLAISTAALGRTTEALGTALRAEGIGAENLRVSVRTLSERQALAYEGIRASGLDLALTLASDQASTPSARGQVFDAVIHSRALIFDELAERYHSAYGRGDPEVAQLANQLSSARAQLATLIFRGPGDAQREAYRKLLDDAREKKEKAEQMLAQKSLSFRQDQARAKLGLKEIAASLPQGTALVAFVRYAKYDLRKPEADKAPPKPVPSYAAFVLQAGAQQPEFVPLGAAQKIESLLAAWRQDVARQADVMDVFEKTGENTYRRTGFALGRRIWDPLAARLGDAKEVFVVPDAALDVVNLAALPVAASQYLVETGPLIHYLSTERDLVPAQSRRGEGILVVGNPAFDHANKAMLASNQQPASMQAPTGDAPVLLRGSRSACGAFQSLRFSPLPASQREADNIAALWKKTTSEDRARIEPPSAAQSSGSDLLELTGGDASPEAFEQYAPGKRVLHVATHGFFLEGSCESAVQRRLDANKRDETFLPATAENPLLLSGLAFAGANRRGSAKPDETDGILTAEEIAGINLEGVDWAVLSACDTGVGEIKVGEGVFGLRRAFQIAGAKTVIMSLWSIDDQSTREWMGTLYREHFLNSKDTGESVRAASLHALRQRRAKHQSTHPFYWGAFIAAGDWR